MATSFQSELDGTNGAAVNAANSGFDSTTGTWVYDTAVKASGSASAKLVLTAGTGLLTRIHGSVTTRGYDFMMRLSTLDGGGPMLSQIKLGATNVAQITVNATGQILLKNGTATVDTSATVINVAEWFRIQWLVTGTTQSLRLWVSATVAGLYAGTPTELMTGAYTGGTWDTFKVGCNTVHTLTLNLDRVVIDDATWPNIGTTGNVTPTANAGPDQSKTAGQTVTMAGSGTDPDGTIASYAWTQVSGPAITLSSATAQNPTFTAPAVSSTSDVVLGLRVTDNGGAVSAQDTVTISVAPASSGPPAEDFYQLFNTGPAGATVTTANTNFDDMSAGITFTSDAIGEGAFAAGGAGGALQFLTHIFTATSSRYADAVYKVDSLAGAPYYLMSVNSGGTVRASVRVNADGTIQLRNGTTAVTGAGLSTATVTAGQPFRIAFHANNGGTMEAKLFTGANLWGSTPDTGGTISGTQNTGTFDRMRFGLTVLATVNWVVDSVRANAASYPLPITGGAATPHSNLWVVQSDGSLLERTLTVIA